MMKKLSAFLFAALCSLSSFAQSVKITVQNPDSGITISKHIYGHFSEHLGRCIYDGFWVNEGSTIPNKGRIRLDVVEALKKINIPNLRWPGGCFADEYHWRDGIGPRNQRPKMVNTNWGGVTEDNSFGTHEFLDLCKMLNTEPYIAGNVGSGTVEEMAKWVEYLNSDAQSTIANMRRKNGQDKPWKVTFWGVGNESWGCGGNMTAEFYSDEYRRYATYARNYPGAPLKRIASGPNGDDYHWTETLMKNVGTRMWGLTLHHYTIPTGSWRDKGSATKFDTEEYLNTMKNCYFMEELVSKHSAIMDKYDPEKKVALVVDEWGVWTNVEPGTNPGFLYQQNSLRDALIAGTTLNIFNNHAGRVKMANLAQTVNVLQALVLTDKNRMLLTPTYYIFDLYKVHQDATLLPLKVNTPELNAGDKKIDAVNASASKDKNGVIHISLVNVDPAKKNEISASIADLKGKTVTGRIVTSGKATDINTFDQPKNVIAKSFSGAKLKGNEVSVELPPLSVVMLEIK